MLWENVIVKIKLNRKELFGIVKKHLKFDINYIIITRYFTAETETRYWGIAKR